MSIRNLVAKAVDIAFSKAGDLVVQGTLVRAANEGFNFQTNQIETNPTTKEVAVLLFGSKGKSQSSNNSETEIYLKFKEAIDVKEGDTIQIPGKTFKVLGDVFGNGFVFQVKAGLIL